MGNEVDLSEYLKISDYAKLYMSFCVLGVSSSAIKAFEAF